MSRVVARPFMIAKSLTMALTVVAEILLSPASRVVHAGPPVITLGPDRVSVKVAQASLFDAVDALARTAGFAVTYDGARPARMLYGAEIAAATVPQALVKMLDGQNINYAMVLDLSGRRVTSLIIMGAPKSTAAAGAGSGNPAGTRSQPFASPRQPRVDLPPVDDEPAPEEEASPEPIVPPPATPGPPASVQPPVAGTPNPGFRTSPFGPRPPYLPPFGPNPRPSPSP